MRVVAEIGGNHRGDLEVACEMIRVLGGWCRQQWSGAPRLPKLIVKFQKRTPDAAVWPSSWDDPHPEPYHAYGPTYREHRRALEFSVEHHRALRMGCSSQGLGYACSVWDEQAAQDIISVRPSYIKVPSACNLDFQLIGRLCSAYEGQIHISLGMTAWDEVERIVSYVERMGASKRTWLYHCTSAYPAPMDAVYLDTLTTLREMYGHRVAGFGFSGHHLGIGIDLAAVALGAQIIERHFTFDRTWRGTDHAASLEPDGFRRLLRDVAAVSAARGVKPTAPLAVEQEQRAKLKRKPTDRVIPDRMKALEGIGAR